jgi:hypothetical protein
MVLDIIQIHLDELNIFIDVFINNLEKTNVEIKEG